MSSIPLARYMGPVRDGEWDRVGDLMLESVAKVARAGATFAICPDNTIHEALPYVLPRSPIPWLHIAAVVADDAARQGFRRLGVLGTRYLMEGPVYRAALADRGIDWRVPDPSDRAAIDAAIFGELVKGIFRDETRERLYRIMEALRREGCDAAVLGCTELPLIVRPEDAPLPTLDSTRLLARAALRRATSA
jgi:aspartate racemase